jgi:cobyrinic acid a,c-diamide synthase
MSVAWIVAAPASGSGKTSITLGLAKACARRGLRVQCFKVGPDYLDPTYLKQASGQPCLNLDIWMCGKEYVRRLFNHAMNHNDIVLIEGVMGLFDGASSTELEGSTAEIARWLDVPILLVVPAKGMARSIAPLVHGFCSFLPELRIQGVVANFVGSPAHVTLLREALASAKLPPLLGAIPKDALVHLPGRHLGLHAAEEHKALENTLHELANQVERSIECETMFENWNERPQGLFTAPWQVPAGVPSIRVGLACDAAFRFTYADNLQALAEAGVRWVPFSPLQDRVLPANLDAVYFPGGYPELHASTLSANRSLLESIREAISEGMGVYAECGGLMYLSQGIHTLQNEYYSMLGVLPTATRMLSKRKSLGYVTIEMVESSCWGPIGTTLRGHEFHYSEMVEESLVGWKYAYTLQSRKYLRCEGYQKDRVLASYVHLHWADHPESCHHFVNYFRGSV